MNPEPMAQDSSAPIKAQIVPPDFLESPRYHAFILIGSLGILIAAGMMRTNGTSAVRLRGVSFDLPEFCFAKRSFGITCPGCGLTRSTISMTRGNVIEAFHYNPMGPIIFTLIVAQLPFRIWAISRMRRGQTCDFPFANGLAVIVVTGLILQWIIRLLW